MWAPQQLSSCCVTQIYVLEGLRTESEMCGYVCSWVLKLFPKRALLGTSEIKNKFRIPVTF